MNLGELYPGAYGEDIYLKLDVELKKLRIYEAITPFPKNPDLINKFDYNRIDLKSGEVVVLNAVSNELATDVFLVRKNGSDILIMIQCKWNDYNDYPIKNSRYLIQSVKQNNYDFYEFITIFFTPQPYDRLRDIKGVLTISKDNFHKHFGPIFSSLATFFFTKEINSNFWEKK
jgi:hypothetical protein